MSTAPPVVILEHGLGATREMRLDAFVERFAHAGIAALAFTYRHFDDSGGQPRQLLSIKRLLADWDAAIEWVKNRRDVDGSRIAVWGSSFGGGHSITVASRYPELRAAVAQCPLTDGLASALALGPTESLKVLPSARDFASMVFQKWGETVTAYVAPREGHAIDLEALHALCARKLADYQRPTSITVLDAIPKNAVGKTDKAPLRAAHLRGTSS